MVNYKFIKNGIIYPLFYCISSTGFTGCNHGSNTLVMRRITNYSNGNVRATTTYDANGNIIRNITVGPGTHTYFRAYNDQGVTNHSVIINGQEVVIDSDDTNSDEINDIQGTIDGDIDYDVRNVLGTVNGNIFGNVLGDIASTGSVSGSVEHVNGDIHGTVGGSVKHINGNIGSQAIIQGRVGRIVGNVYGTVGEIDHVVGNIGAHATIQGRVGHIVGNVYGTVGEIDHVVGNIGTHATIPGRIGHVVGNISGAHARIPGRPRRQLEALQGPQEEEQSRQQVRAQQEAQRVATANFSSTIEDLIKKEMDKVEQQLERFNNTERCFCGDGKEEEQEHGRFGPLSCCKQYIHIKCLRTHLITKYSNKHDIKCPYCRANCSHLVGLSRNTWSMCNIL